MIFVKIKYFLRTRHPWLFQRLVSMRYCGLGSEWVAVRRRRAARRVLRDAAPYFPVRLYSRCGFGAMLSHALEYLRYCEQNGYQPLIEFHNPLYAQEPHVDWLPEFFTSKVHGEPDASMLRFLPVESYRDYAAKPVAGDLSLTEAAAVFNRHLIIKPKVLEEVDEFVAANFHGRVLGVHFRGTDKYLESGAQSPEGCMDEVAGLLAADPRLESVFVGTDEPAFLTAFVERFGHLNVSNYHLGPPLSAERPRHLSKFPGLLLAREALVTMLLFSRCDVCLRTCSHLSGWSRILNPSLKTLTLIGSDAGDLGFPDRQIVASEEMERRRRVDVGTAHQAEQ